MDVICHKCIGMDSAISDKCALRKHGEKYLAICIAKKAGPAVVAALDDMQGDAWKYKAWLAWHFDPPQLLETAKVAIGQVRQTR